MSFTFYVHVGEVAPRLSAIAELVDDPRWACDDGAEDDAPLGPGHFPHVYSRGRAARGVELAYEHGDLGARIMTCSSRADHELAIRIVSALAKQHRVGVTPEDHDAPMDLTAFAAAYGAAWIAEQVAWAPATVARMVDDKGSILTMSGPRRPFYLGPRFLGELRARGGDLNEALLAAMIALQDVDEERYYASSVMEVTPRTGEPSFSLAVWGPGASYLFPNVDRLALRHEAETIDIPHARGRELAGARWTWLDEHHALVDETPTAEWPALIARARAVAIH